jgi:hypothetical protein
MRVYEYDVIVLATGANIYVKQSKWTSYLIYSIQSSFKGGRLYIYLLFIERDSKVHSSTTYQDFVYWKFHAPGPSMARECMGQPFLHP